MVHGVDSVDSQPGMERELSLLSVVGFVVVSVCVFEKRSHCRVLAGLELGIGSQPLPLDFLGFRCVLLHILCILCCITHLEHINISPVLVVSALQF